MAALPRPGAPRLIAVLIGVVAGAATQVVLACGAVAAAPVPARVTLQDHFTSGLPGTSSGRSFSIDIREPSDPNAKPPVLTREVLHLAAGARFDTGAIPGCDDSNPSLLTAELLAVGPSACPDGSQLGLDYATLDTGFSGQGRFITTKIIVLNAAGEMVFLVTDPSSGARTFVFYGTVTSDSITVDVPTFPGTPPDGQASDYGERETLNAASSVTDGRTRNYLTTPPTCPSSGRWVNSTTFYFKNGAVETVDSAIPCSSASGGPQQVASRGNQAPAASSAPLPDTGTGGGDGSVAVALVFVGVAFLGASALGARRRKY